MKNPPAAVIPMPVERLAKSRLRSAVPAISSRPESGPIQALVIDGSARARQLVCRAGRRVSGAQSQWLEATDMASASRTLATSEIDIVVADSRSIRSDLRGLTAAKAGGADKSAPLVVVISEDDEPERIQQMLDAGAHSYLPKRLPQRFLQTELYRLVTQLRTKQDPSPAKKPALEGAAAGTRPETSR